MTSTQQFARDVAEHEASLGQVFRELKSSEEMLDVNLVTTEGQIKAHKVVLSACSSFFKTVLHENIHPHPIIYLKGVNFSCLEKLVSFMYNGEVTIEQDDLTTFMDVAKDLQVKGLALRSVNEVCAQTSKRQRTETTPVQGRSQINPPANLSMIFYSNPTVKSEPNTNTVPPNTTLYNNTSYHQNIKLEQTLADIKNEASQHSVPTVMAGTVSGLPSGHFQVGSMDTTVTSDSQGIRVKPSSDLLNSTRPKILENKSLGLWMCSACTFTHHILTNMQSHIQTSHF